MPGARGPGALPQAWSLVIRRSNDLRKNKASGKEEMHLLDFDVEQFGFMKRVKSEGGMQETQFPGNNSSPIARVSVDSPA